MHRHTHQPLRAGAMTVLAAIVVLCLAVLAVLSLSTARADLAMADRQLALVNVQAEAERAGQEWLAAVDTALRDGTALPAGTAQGEDGQLHATLAVDATHTLQLAVDAATLQPTRWQLETAWEADSGQTLWQG